MSFVQHCFDYSETVCVLHRKMTTLQRVHDELKRSVSEILEDSKKAFVSFQLFPVDVRPMPDGGVTLSLRCLVCFSLESMPL